jgi:hypothetical protein
MDPTIFNQRVDELLEPALKSTIRTPPTYRHADWHPRMESIRLAPKSKPCVDCGIEVKDRRIHYVLYAINSPKEHWKKICTGCDRKTILNNGLKDIKK